MLSVYKVKPFTTTFLLVIYYAVILGITEDYESLAEYLLRHLEIAPDPSNFSNLNDPIPPVTPPSGIDLITVLVITSVIASYGVAICIGWYIGHRK